MLNSLIKNHFISIILFFVFWSNAVIATETYTPQFCDMIPQKFCWSQFNNLSGLGAHCFTEDSTGHFWFGLEKGIMHYDGLHWKHYSQASGLPTSFIQNIATAPDGKVYGVYEHHGVYYFENNGWHYLPTIKPDSSTLFMNISFTGKDSLWIATNKGAIFKTPAQQTCYTPHRIQHIVKSDNALQDSCLIYQIFEDNDKNLWMVDISKGGSDFYYIPNWRQNINAPAKWKQFIGATQTPPVGTRSKIYQASDDKFYIYSYNELSGIYSFANPETNWKYYNLTEHGGNNLVLSLIETQDKTIWIGGNGYLYKLINNKIKTYGPTELNLQIAPIELIQSRDGALWLLGLNAELYRIDYSRKNWDILRDLHFQCDIQDSIYFYISSDGKIVKQDADSWQCYDSTDGMMNMPLVLLSTKENEIWTAGSHYGIAAVSRLIGDSWRTDYFPDLSWSISYLAALQTHDGNLWFGSMGDPAGDFLGGCIVYEQTTSGDYQIRHLISETESFNRIGSLTETTDSTLWAGGSHLLYYDTDKFKLYKGLQELRKGWIDHIYAGSKDELFVAKGGVGVFKKSEDKWSRFDVQDELASNMVTNILETDDQQILISTPRGISKYDGNSWIRQNFPDKITIKRESGTLRQSTNGRLWINQAPREWYFRAAYRPHSPNENYAGFRTISYQGDSLAPKSTITFFQNRLTRQSSQLITWTGDDYWGITPQEELTFSYRMDGGPWSHFSTTKSVQFAGLADGHHTFELRACDRDGNIQAHPSIAKFYIVPAIWKQPWFILLLTFFSSAIAFLLISLMIYNRKLLTAKQKIEEIASFRERFFLNISHEIRTPLTLILAPLKELLKSEKLSQQSIHKQLSMIQHHALYLKQIMTQLLNFKKLEIAAPQLQVKKDDLVKFVRHVFNAFQVLADTHHITYKFECPFSELTAWSDSQRLEIILMNLIGNAFKFTPDHGQITVSLRTPKYLSEELTKYSKQKNLTLTQKQFVEICISDTGIGIPQNRLAHIFDRFYHSEHPGQLYYDNIGIGLDFTKEIIDLYRGTIHVKSTEGQGSTFTVILPIDDSLFFEHEKKSSDSTAIHQLVNANLDEIQANRKKLLSKLNQSSVTATTNISANTPTKPEILIVEDHPDMVALLTEFLCNDYCIYTATDGRTGFERALHHVPDLIISDVMMPVMDGIELTHKIKSNIVTSHIPVILLTIKNELGHRIEGIESGADAYITKPFDSDELTAQIKNLIQTRNQLRQRYKKEIKIEPEEISKSSLDAIFLHKCITCVEKHISEQSFQVDLLCQELSMSRTQAYRKLKNITGFSLNEFILHIKLKRASQLLSNTDMNISEIAYALGFSDHAHFSRHFKKKIGCPPKEYRKAHKKKTQKIDPII